MTPPPVHVAGGSGVARVFRYAYRVPLLLIHLLLFLPITLLCLSPLLVWIRVGDENAGDVAVRWWSGGLMRIFGFRLRRVGKPLPGPTLFVANHVSWIDIELMHSQRMMGFVAKAEIARWPLVGWLASRGGTIYHHRGSNDSLHGVMHQMVQRLEQGLSVGVFPEGRTTRGDAIATFHARIFQPAVVANVPAQPVALKYGLRGNAQTIIAFGERENFFQNFVRLLGEPGRVAEVHVLEPGAASEDGRRRMADTCRERIIAAMAG